MIEASVGAPVVAGGVGCCVMMTTRNWSPRLRLIDVSEVTIAVWDWEGDDCDHRSKTGARAGRNPEHCVG